MFFAEIVSSIVTTFEHRTLSSPTFKNIRWVSLWTLSMSIWDDHTQHPFYGCHVSPSSLKPRDSNSHAMWISSHVPPCGDEEVASKTS